MCLLKDETEEKLKQQRLGQIQHQQKLIRWNSRKNTGTGAVSCLTLHFLSLFFFRLDLVHLSPIRLPSLADLNLFHLSLPVRRHALCFFVLALFFSCFSSSSFESFFLSFVWFLDFGFLGCALWTCLPFSDRSPGLLGQQRNALRWGKCHWGGMLKALVKFWFTGCFKKFNPQVKWFHVCVTFACSDQWD